MSIFSKANIVASENFNRWLVPPISISIHLCIGSVYAWSMFNPALTTSLGVVTSSANDWSLSDVVWIFSTAVENIHTTSLNDQSFAELVTTPRDVVRAGLNILHAYTDPIHKCIEIEMGGTNHLLKFSLATIFAFEKMLNFTPLHLVL